MHTLPLHTLPRTHGPLLARVTQLSPLQARVGCPRYLVITHPGASGMRRSSSSSHPQARASSCSRGPAVRCARPCTNPNPSTKPYPHLSRCPCTTARCTNPNPKPSPKPNLNPKPHLNPDPNHNPQAQPNLSPTPQAQPLALTRCSCTKMCSTV